MSRLLLRNASLQSGECCDVLIEGVRIAAMGQTLDPGPVTQTIDAAGGLLLPGLTDHHLHLASLAAAKASVACGPPDVRNAAALAACLSRAAQARGAEDWLRGIGYHDSVAGDIDAAWLDAVVPHCPVRIQHRCGRLWVFNSRALELLKPVDADPLERRQGRLTGRLYEGDAWLRSRLRTGFPDLSAVSRELATHGITQVTDTTPHNNWHSFGLFARAARAGQLKQKLTIMGDASLDSAAPEPRIPAAPTRGAHKFHLLESSLPDLDTVIDAIRKSHEAGRNAAFHCVTRTELVFALAALRAAGVRSGDRIEHASVAPPELVEQMAALGLIVVTQPVFIAQRGDQYLEQVSQEDQPWLYRLQGLLEAGIPVAGSSDAPYGSVNPWRAMHAAVMRSTEQGAIIGSHERLTPEQALALYTSPMADPGGHCRSPAPGNAADLCLLAKPWSVVRENLSKVQVRMTVIDGVIV